MEQSSTSEEKKTVVVDIYIYLLNVSFDLILFRLREGQNPGSQTTRFGCTFNVHFFFFIK